MYWTSVLYYNNTLKTYNTNTYIRFSSRRLIGNKWFYDAAVLSDKMWYTSSNNYISPLAMNYDITRRTIGHCERHQIYLHLRRVHFRSFTFFKRVLKSNIDRHYILVLFIQITLNILFNLYQHFWESYQKLYHINDMVYVHNSIGGYCSLYSFYTETSFNSIWNILVVRGQ